jgi:hypothetical protein
MPAPCRCPECLTLASAPAGLLAAFGWPRPHTPVAAELAEAVRLGRRWAAGEWPVSVETDFVTAEATR